MPPRKTKSGHAALRYSDEVCPRHRQRIEHLPHTRKQLRAAAQGTAINLQEAPLQSRGFIARGVRKSGCHDLRGAVAHRGAHHLVGHRCKAFLGAQRVERAGHVGCGVEQGTVHIEQNGPQRQRHPLFSLLKCAR